MMSSFVLKKLLPLTLALVLSLVMVSYVYQKHVISPREAGLSLLVLVVGIALWVVLVRRRVAGVSQLGVETTLTPTDR